MKGLFTVYLNFAVILIFLDEYTASAGDPCQTYSVLPRKNYRYFGYSREDGSHDHDYYLPKNWYRADNLTMTNSPPDGFDTCGTSIPIWMKGDNPTVEEGIVNRTACSLSYLNWCAIEYNVQVKNCENFYVYNLLPTSTRLEGYCFGFDAPVQETEVPEFQPKQPKMTVGTKRINQGRMSWSMVNFVCQFGLPAEAEKYWYMVEWIASEPGKPDKRFNTSKETSDKLDNLEIKEVNFVRTYKLHMGIYLSCRVFVYRNQGDETGGVSPRSESLFLGIHVNVIDKVIQRGKSGSIEFKSNVPVGCLGEGSCQLSLHSFVPSATCAGSPGFETFCGVQINSKAWNETYTATIYPHDAMDYAFGGIFDVHFKTTDVMPLLMWNNYQLPPVQIQVGNSGTTWQGKVCYSRNDPHMKTFDGRRYEHHQPGTYVLYAHKKYNAIVQIKLDRCSGYRAVVMCNCGVAVRAGNEVYVIDKCTENNPVFSFKTPCGGDTVTPRRISESLYRIHLVYGTYVVVYIGSVSSRWINVEVVPSIHDQDKGSTGLCGQLSGDCTDDFQLRDGKLSPENNDCNSPWNTFPNTFIDNWRVPEKESLFIFDEKLEKSLQPWVSSVCFCPSGKEGITTKLICKKAPEDCFKGQKVGVTVCARLKRRKRDVRWQDRFPQKTRRIESHFVSKRAATNKTWSIESATKFCNEYLSKSPVFGLCGKVPSAKPELSLENCIMDIILTHTTEWSNNALNLMQGSCNNEIDRNNTLREEPKKNKSEPNLAETIQANTCPGLCSGNGKCDNGSCICNPGFGFDDCSLDISVPPDIYGITDDGLCDEREIPCTEAMIHGETFTDIGNLTCKIHPFIMPHGSYKRSNQSITRVKGQLDTLFEVHCPVNGTEIYEAAIMLLPPGESSIIGCTVSVSNDGINFGDQVELYLYDSACLRPIKSNDKYKFELQNDYCLIQRRCVADEVLSDDDPCLMCNAGLNRYNWTERKPEDCIPTTTTTTSSTTTTTPKKTASMTSSLSITTSTTTTATSTTTTTTPPTSTTTTATSTSATTTTPSTSTTTTTPTSTSTTSSSTSTSTTKPSTSATSTTSSTSTTTIPSTSTTTTTSSTTPSTSTPSSTTTTTSSTSTTTIPSTSTTTTTSSTTPSTSTPTSTTTTPSTSGTTATSSASTSITPATSTASTTSSTTTATATPTSTPTKTSSTSTTTTTPSTSSITTTKSSLTNVKPSTTSKISTTPSESTTVSSISTFITASFTLTTPATSSTSKTAKEPSKTTTTFPTTEIFNLTKNKSEKHSILGEDTIIATISGLVGILVISLITVAVIKLYTRRKRLQAYLVKNKSKGLNETQYKTHHDASDMESIST